jgi:hypothetical protein
MENPPCHPFVVVIREKLDMPKSMQWTTFGASFVFITMVVSENKQDRKLFHVGFRVESIQHLLKSQYFCILIGGDVCPQGSFISITYSI